MTFTGRQTRITIQPTKYVRMPNTRNGNPVYVIHTDDGRKFQTRRDATDAYKIVPTSDRAMKVELDDWDRIMGLDYIED